MEKYAWKASLLSGKRDEYVRRHNEIWPEMVRELKQAGVCNYTIWLDGDLLFGYYECERGAAFALEYQANSSLIQKWEASMHPIMTMFKNNPRQVFELK